MTHLLMEIRKMELSEIKALLADRNLSAVAEQADVSYFALARWMRGDTDSPSYEMVAKVIKYLESQQLIRGA